MRDYVVCVYTNENEDRGWQPVDNAAEALIKIQTGKQVKVVHVANDPVNQRIGATDRAGGSPNARPRGHHPLGSRRRQLRRPLVGRAAEAAERD